MAKILDLQAKTRTAEGTSAVKRLRKTGIVPAVIYGKKHANAKLEVDNKIFSRILKDSASDNILVNLNIEGEKHTSLALVQNVQHDYLRGGILHVDFHAVAADEDIHANAAINLIGVEVAEKKGGKLEFILHSLEVHCLPKDLPDLLTIDVSALNIGDAFHVRDIALPSGVSTHMDGDIVVAILKEPLVVEEPVPVVAATAAAAPAAAAPAKGGAAPVAAVAAPAAKASPAKK